MIRATRRTAGLLAAWIVAALGAAACDSIGTDAVPPGRLVAEQRYNAALEHSVRLEYADARRELRAALITDPTYLPALVQFIHVSPPGPSLYLPDFIDSLAALTTDPGLSACYAQIAAHHRGTTSRIRPPQRRSPVAATCQRYHDNHNTYIRRTTVESASRDLAAEFPGSPSILRWRLSELGRTQQWDALVNLARAKTRPESPPLVRATAWISLALGAHEQGRDNAARDAEAAARRDPAWQLPGFRVAWYGDAAGHASLWALSGRTDPSGLTAHVDSVMDAAGRELLAAAAEGDRDAHLAVSLEVFVSLLNRGRIEEAVRGLEALVPLADSAADAGLRAYTRMRLGRAYVKRGRPREAERELLLARSLVRPERLPAVHKEVEHNLLHLYESLGRDADARAAGEAFVRYASLGGLHDVRMMSARDLGIFLRTRGFEADSRAHFSRMLADIDSLGSSWFYAGEYHELAGDPESARAYYERGLDQGNEPVRALEGLVRVALSMGDTAGARRWAMSHDARRDAVGRPESAPLLPTVMARTGARNNARLAFEQARVVVDRHGQVAAWASLTADLAALELDAAQHARARELADSAATAAARVGSADIVRRAGALSAAAAVRLGGPAQAGAMRSLRDAARTGERTAPLALRAELHRLAAGAEASTGRWRESLEWYARAAAPLDSSAAAITMDPRQAAFRSAQRQVYDDALRTIVRHAGDPGAADAFARWSVRRKGRAYAVQLATRDAGLPTARAEGSAIVDYVVLDSIVAALVVTPGGARVVQLATPASTIRADVAQLRRALDVRIGSALDMSRARYPLTTAHRLYLALVAPLEAFIGQALSLTVVPDGVLGLVPFDALVTAPPPADGDERQATFLMDRYTVVHAATLRTSARAWTAPEGRVVAIAPFSAPGGPAEVAAIIAAVGKRRLVVLSGAAATRNAAVRAAANAGVVHFVAHAHANDREPAASWIELAPESGHDGALRASDISSFTLDAPLVILSACETAGGQALEGEGVLSLSRSFLQAGARATVATLWPVGPLASEFFREFYAHMTPGTDLAYALRATKQTMRASGAPAFAWAPYQLFAAPHEAATAPTRVAVLRQAAKARGTAGLALR